MSDSSPRLERTDTPDGPCVRLLGRWGAAQLGTRAQWRALSVQLRGQRAAAGLGWDLRGLEWLDHVGAQLLWNHWGRAWPERLALDASQRAMLDRVARLSCTAAPPEPWRLADQIDRLGTLVMHGVDHARHLLLLVGQLLLDSLRVLRAPRRAPWRDVSGHLYSMGAMALPITALVGFLIGVVLAYLMSLQLRQFGAEAFIVNILGISLIRELGPLLGAILVAGRSGSAITAQIGVMRVTEELDAMSVMGIPHGFRLVLPRALALAIAMPLISIWTTLAALAGGMLAADMAMGISPAYFFEAMPAAVKLGNLWLALSKSVVFGTLIALIGCHWGLRVKPNTQSLGEGTTASVVTSITVVIIVDAVFAVVFKNVGF
ncbi:MAG: ABC transporter permease [Simplicispira sp.]|uniref:MlaE family ABC transporter permease n=1 Tax=Simplicispira sp. TaxID=2015802 RepID=UPI001B47B3F3|nr:ABC transporter permease [Simplicispira sp.]MBP7413244.1 ABC transporter permease [Giesbergeria sp.]MBP8204928.1 ABC transporter permease [Giesbergeria sp.]MDD2692039.1 ABC transporter permease [Simplicispira sp.]